MWPFLLAWDLCTISINYLLGLGVVIGILSRNGRIGRNMNGFIKEELMLEEQHRVPDHLNFSEEVDRLHNLISKIVHSSMVSYIGKYGSGKSTVLYQLEKRLTEVHNAFFFEFDAWKYPERKDLWEGFVIDIAEQLGRKKSVTNKIDNTKGVIQKTGSVIFDSMTIALAGVSLPVSKVFTSLFKDKPITRVFELQDLLIKMLGSIEDKNIYIVVEDIDRSGDNGIFFLETLRQFIKNNLPEKTIIVLTPIGTEAYSDKQRTEAYQKIFDYTLHLDTKGINYTQFIDAFFDDKAFDPNTVWRQHLIDWFSIVKAHNYTPREVKGLIRSANLAYKHLTEKGLTVDVRVLLCFTYLYTHIENAHQRYITKVNLERKIVQNTPMHNLFIAIANNKSLEQTIRSYHLLPLDLISENGFPVPRLNERFVANEQTYFLSDFYLTPFEKTAQK
jgi:adenylylsulfate kinase-like enzyme